ERFASTRSLTAWCLPAWQIERDDVLAHQPRTNTTYPSQVKWSRRGSTVEFLYSFRRDPFSRASARSQIHDLAVRHRCRALRGALECRALRGALECRALRGALGAKTLLTRAAPDLVRGDGQRSPEPFPLRRRPL